jgi:hypothetical protein
MAFVVFSVTFLCCRGVDSIPSIYVIGINFVRANALVTALYYTGFRKYASLNRT